jgi:hypothetical protein
MLLNRQSVALSGRKRRCGKTHSSKRNVVPAVQFAERTVRNLTVCDPQVRFARGNSRAKAIWSFAWALAADAAKNASVATASSPFLPRRRLNSRAPTQTCCGRVETKRGRSRASLIAASATALAGCSLRHAIAPQSLPSSAATCLGETGLARCCKMSRFCSSLGWLIDSLDLLVYDDVRAHSIDPSRTSVVFRGLLPSKTLRGTVGLTRVLQRKVCID